MNVGIPVKCISSCYILIRVDFLDLYSKFLQITNLMKIHPGEAGLFIAERRTDIKTDRHDGIETEIIYNRKIDFDFCLQVIY